MAWYALVFTSVPAMFFACGGRSDLGLEDEDGPQVAGKGGASGKSGATGASGTSGATTGGASQGGFGGANGGASQGGKAQGGAGQGGVSQGGKSGSGTAGFGGKGGGGKSGKAGNGSGGKDLFDSGIPIPDSGPIGDCAQCIAQKCDDSINGCYNDPDCLGGIQCAVTTCLAGGGMGGNGSGGGGGGLDFQCILGCFNGDFGAALTAVQAFQCITGTCGGVCSALIPGGPGGGDGGPGGGGMGSGGGGPGGPDEPGGPQPAWAGQDPFGGGVFSPYLAPGEMWIGETRVPFAEEVPGYPALADALRRP